MILNQTATLYTRNTVIDSFGGEELSYTIYSTCKACIEPASNSISSYAGRIGIDATHVCFLPSNVAINTTMRLACDGNTYQITKMQDWRIGSGMSNHIEIWLSLNTSPQASIGVE